jgi:S1-C subfamily serine protease
MHTKTIIALAVLSSMLLGPTVAGAADELATKGQEIFEKNQRAVVTVEVVLNTSYSGKGQNSEASERKYDLTGTVLDPSGLTVLALSCCDPMEFYRRVMPEKSEYKVESGVSDIKILLEDGTELPAEIVLRDKDLDLAFIRPKTPPATPMKAVDLNKCGTAKVLEQVVILNRLNKASGRAYSAALDRIIAVVTKPRTFYLQAGVMAGSALGAPVFSLDGNLLGVMVMRVGGSSGGTYRDNAASIILPAEHIFKAAKQAPPAKGETAEAKEKK